MGNLSIDRAVDLWREELSFAARRGHRVEVVDGAIAASFGFTSTATWNELLAGEPVSWSDLVVHVDERAVEQFGEDVDESDRCLVDRGYRSLYVCAGFIEVTDGEWLPIALAPVEARRVGRQVDDWTVELENDLGGSPVVRRVLLDEWGIDLGVVPHDVAGLLNLIDGLRAKCAGVGGPAVVCTAGFALQTSPELGALRDLQTFPGIGRSSLLRALAGDDQAIRDVRGQAGALGDRARCVLPADSSQAEIVELGVGGATIVVEGPPGCGKSQTIANLLAAIAGQGRTALFVTEKRAAASVVIDRLASVGLDRLVFDAHDTARRLDEGDLRPVERGSMPTEALREVDLSSSHEHFAAMRRMHAGLGPLVDLGVDRTPDVDPDIAEAIMTFAPGLEQIVDVAEQVIERCTELGVIVGAGLLIELAGAVRREPEVLVKLDEFSSLDCSLDELRGLAPGFGAAIDLDDEVAADAPLLELVSGRGVTWYRGRYTMRSLRDNVLRRVGDAGASARSLGLLDEEATSGNLFALLRGYDWSPSLWASDTVRLVAGLHRSQGFRIGQSGVDAVIETLRSIVPHLLRLDADDLDTLRYLNDLGILEGLLAAPSASEALNAAYAKSLLAGPAIVSAAALDREATMATEALIQERRIERERVASAVGDRMAALEDENPRDEIELAGLLRRAASQRITVGQALRRAPGAVLRRRPVVLASPWTLGRAIAQDTERFDVVIFDEASQIETASAIPALSRSRAAVLFGDSHQLPPTMFFRTRLDDGADPVLGQTALLDAFGALLGGSRSEVALRWHYRSHDDSLVNFVNHRPSLYGGSMITTPPPRPDPDALELVSYDGDASSAVRALLQRLPDDENVAVLTMNLRLADELDDALGRSHTSGSDVTVINLEQFQGEERDTVVLVLSPPGEGVSALQSLGPINLPGGDRRLNVALTRAKRRMFVLAPYSSGELGDASTTGATMLQDFLELLEAGDSGATAIVAPDSAAGSRELGESLAAQLRQEGFVAEVRDVLSPAAIRLVVGNGERTTALDFDFRELTELTAHDREIVRLGELERRGWAIVRMTIAEWVFDRAGSIRRIRSHLGEGGVS